MQRSISDLVTNQVPLKKKAQVINVLRKNDPSKTMYYLNYIAPTENLNIYGGVKTMIMVAAGFNAFECMGVMIGYLEKNNPSLMKAIFSIQDEFGNTAPMICAALEHLETLSLIFGTDAIDNSVKNNDGKNFG
jgi:hypothetical protein